MDATTLAERGALPTPLIRLGIRRLLRERLREVDASDCEKTLELHERFLSEARRAPIAIAADAANRQHYELPAALFALMLGPRLKYSCAIWPSGVRTLAEAEDAMLALTAERAQIADGQRILDLGCGWGSFALWCAGRFPASHVLAVSNAKSQREHILGAADRLALRNLEVVTADVNGFDAGERFDRVVSIEMFEHVRNHAALLERIARWLAPGGRLFVHHFAHRAAAYPYEASGESDWMARHFFTGGMMPSDDWLLAFQDDLRVEARWRVNGTHYAKTSDAWLASWSRNKRLALPILRDVYGAGSERLWFQRWRLFLLGCSELFGYRNGQEWWVSHLRLASRERAR